MKAYVICCNDSIQAVCLDEERAESERKRLEREGFEECTTKRKEHSFTDYCYFYNWHIHDVVLIK